VPDALAEVAQLIAHLQPQARVKAA
jgi:hypothetical protein